MATTPYLTTITPGGLAHTIAVFRSSGLDDIVSLSLLHSATSRLFHKTPPSKTDINGLPIPLTGVELANYRGIAWTKVALPIVGDTGQALIDLSRIHVQELLRVGRSTELTPEIIYDWVSGIWPAVRTHFLASRARNITNKDYALRQNVLWAPDSYEMSFICPEVPPMTLVVDSPVPMVTDSPATIPAVQVFLPATVPFSELIIADPALAYQTHAFAEIAYPSQGAQFTAGVPVTLLAIPGNQVETTHKFTWFFNNRPALSGIQIQTPFLLPELDQKVPITLLVMNKKTGVSASATTFINVVE
jgi:hypothetical protein